MHGTARVPRQNGLCVLLLFPALTRVYCRRAGFHMARGTPRDADGKALVKLVPPAELVKTRDEKRAEAEAKAARKAAAVEAERQKRLAALEKGRVPPQELFRPPNVPEGTYGSWDEDGRPLTDGEGKELSKSAGKKVQKEWALQKKRHEEFLQWQKEQQE